MWRILFLHLVLTSSTVFAQTQEKPKSYIFDEFGRISQAEVKKRTEKLKEKLQENAWKTNSLGAYLIFYYDEKQKSLRSIDKLVRDVLFDNCRDCFGFSPNIVFVNGGKAKEQTIQFWIVPAGAEPPSILKDEKSDLPKAVKFEEFSLISVGELRYLTEKFFQEIVNNPIVRGYVINYGKTKLVLNREKVLRGRINLRNVDASRITFIRGGNKKDFTTELWIVPQSAEPPAP